MVVGSTISMLSSVLALVLAGSPCQEVGQTDEVESAVLGFYLESNKSKFGECIYENGGIGRFVYRFGDKEFTKNAITPEIRDWQFPVVAGYDGNEYWIAIFVELQNERWVRRDTATWVARFDSTDLLEKELPAGIRNAFAGHEKFQSLWNKVAVIENIRDLLGLISSGLDCQGMVNAVESQQHASLATSSTDSIVAINSSFFRKGYSYISISVAEKEDNVWDYVLELDDGEKFPLARVNARTSAKFVAGVGADAMPGSPLPFRWELSRQDSKRVSAVVFHPQHYSDSQTRLLTYGNQVPDEK